MRHHVCPICGYSQLEKVFSLPDIPVFVNVLSDSAEAAISFPRGNQDLVLCQRCGFIFNCDFEPEKVIYDIGYHAERGHSNYYLQHLNHVINYIDKVKPLRNRRLLEVACGGGEFLKKTVERGPKEVIGVDPSVSELVDGPMHLHKGLFDKAYVDHLPYQVDILINRHMIEHILNPLEMLKVFHQALAADGVLYLETPRLDWILENQAFFDISYEHCAYYTDSFIKSLLRMAGFAIVALEYTYDGQYFSICAKKTGARSVLESVPAKELLKTQEAFVTLKNTYTNLNQEEKVHRFRTETVRLGVPSLTMDSVTVEGIYFWGASGKGVMCANLLKKWPIMGLIDKNSNKQGKYVPGTGHPVLAPSKLTYDFVKVVIVENDVYFSEIQDDVRKIDPRISVIALSELIEGMN